jgi:small ligand-binding sensory domain FIST
VSSSDLGLASYATGDLVYASGSTPLAKLTLGTSGYVLTASGSAPAYVAQSTLSVGTATNATNTGTTASSTAATHYLVFKSATTGNLPELVNSAISVYPSTGVITGGISGGTF